MIIQLKCLWPPPYPLGLFLQCHFSKTVQPFLLSKYMYTHIYAEHTAAVHQGVKKQPIYIYKKRINYSWLFPLSDSQRRPGRCQKRYNVCCVSRIIPYHSSPLSLSSFQNLIYRCSQEYIIPWWTVATPPATTHNTGE